jgi:hypothetical protein
VDQNNASIPPFTKLGHEPLFWQKYNNSSGGQALPESLPTRRIVVKATSFILGFTPSGSRRCPLFENSLLSS